MSRVAIMYLRVVIAAWALFIALFNTLAIFMVGLFRIFVVPFISMGRDFYSALTGTPSAPPHKSFLVLRLAIILVVAIGMFVSVVAPLHRRLLHAIAIGMFVCVFCRPWQELRTIYYLPLALLWLGFYVISLTRREATQSNRLP